MIGDEERSETEGILSRRTSPLWCNGIIGSGIFDRLRWDSPPAGVDDFSMGLLSFGGFSAANVPDQRGQRSLTF
jgi:hypothetical protein